MNKTEKSNLDRLQVLAQDFAIENNVEKYECLKLAQKIKWTNLGELSAYGELLLYMAAHPSDSMSLFQVEKNMEQLSVFLKSKKRQSGGQLVNTGLPHTDIITIFSHDLLCWLLEKAEYKVQVDDYTEDAKDLSEVLKWTLPSVERDLCNLGYESADFLKILKVPENNLLSFIASQLKELNDRPILKDQLFESLGIFLKVNSGKSDFSKFQNRFLKKDLFFHDELLKRFDPLELMNRALPVAEKLTEQESEKLRDTIRLSLVLTARETDPSTFMDVSSLRLYALERGVSVAIYGMTESRQLPLESYVGFTFFKNGFPCAYGGSWLFGARALFGMNIFEPYRGGESGYIMCQLLRVYRQAFGISAFEVEPYQFGKDNPDGIKSGAFWFYYKFGFRPDQKNLKQLAEAEKKKINSQKGYFSSYKILEKFTEAYLVLEFEKKKQKMVPEISALITNHIHKKYKGDRALAKVVSQENFSRFFKADLIPENLAYEEWSLTADALGIIDAERLNLIKSLIDTKACDVYEYQKQLLKLMPLI